MSWSKAVQTPFWQRKAANIRFTPIGYVEAGLRSYDFRVPKEYNRSLTDHVSEFLRAPTERVKANLITENVCAKYTEEATLQSTLYYSTCRLLKENPT